MDYICTEHLWVNTWFWDSNFHDSGRIQRRRLPLLEKLIHIPFGVLAAPSLRPIPLTFELALAIQPNILTNMKGEL